MSNQIDFIKRCKALGLHDGSLSDWLDEIESFRAKVAELEEASLTQKAYYESVFQDKAKRIAAEQQFGQMMYASGWNDCRNTIADKIRKGEF